MGMIEGAASHHQGNLNDSDRWSLQTLIPVDSSKSTFDQMRARLDNVPADLLKDCTQGKDYPLKKLVISTGIYHEALESVLLKFPEFQQWDINRQGAGFVESLDGRPDTAKIATEIENTQNEIVTFRSGSQAVWDTSLQGKLARELEAFQLRTGLLDESPSVAFVKQHGGVARAIDEVVDRFQTQYELFVDEDLKNALANRIRVLTEYGNEIFNMDCPVRITAAVSSSISPETMGGFHGHHSKRLLSIEYGETTIGVFKPDLSHFEKNPDYYKVREEQSKLLYGTMVVLGKALLENRPADYEIAFESLKSNL